MGNLHKSDDGWTRLQTRVLSGGNRQSVHSSRMEHRVEKQVVETAVPPPVKVRGHKVPSDGIMRNGSRRRRVAAPNGRSF